MSIDLEYELRRWLRRGAAHVGTPPVAFALMALAAIYVAVASAWSRLGTAEGAAALVSSFAFTGLAVVLVVDALVALARCAPVRSPKRGTSRLRLATMDDWGGLGLRAAYLLVGLAFAASMLARDVLTLRVAEGERATVAVEQYVQRAPTRRFSPGPFDPEFTVERVSGTVRADGTTSELAATVRRSDGSFREVRPWRPLWYGWGRFIAPARAGIALRYSMRLEGGGAIEGNFANLDLLPAGKGEEIRTQKLPYRIVFALPSEPGAVIDRSPALDAAVYRGRMRVAGGRLDAGATLRFDGVLLSVPEVRRWVELTMITDPGIGIAGLAAIVALTALLVPRAVRRRGADDRRSPPPGAAEGEAGESGRSGAV